MTAEAVLRLLSAHTRVELVGVDSLPDAVLTRLHGVLGQLEDPATAGDPAARRLRVTASAGRPTLDGERLPDDPDIAAAVLVAALDRALLDTTPCLTLHAAVVAGPLGAMVVPAVSGGGKSTLAGACQQAGLLLVSDEAACLDPDEDVLWPHPRPLGLDHRSRELLGLPEPEDGPAHGERATSPALLGEVAPVDRPVVPVGVVLPDRDPAARPASLTPTGTAQALAILLDSCLNTGSGRPWTPERAWWRLTQFARTVPASRLSYDRPREGAEALAAVLT